MQDGERVDYRRETINITLPVFLELLVSTLFGMVDMMMVGNSGSPAITTPSIAAIGITNQIMFIGIALVQSLTTGGTTMIARYVGAKDYDKVSPVLKHLIIISLFAVILPFLLITQLFPVNLMSLIGAKKDAIDIGLTYFRIVSLGFLFQSFNLTIFSAMRGTGDTKTPMTINLSVNLLNVIGNWILIFGRFGFPKLGVTGAAVSTTLSHIVASIVLLITLSDEKALLRLSLKERFIFNKKTIKNLINIGGPAAGEQIAFRIGVLIFVRIVSGLGTVVYATHQIGLNILSLSYAPGQAFGIASSTLVGRSLGENSIEKARRYIRESMKLSLAVSIIVGCIFFFFGRFLTNLYTSDTEIISQSEDILKLMAFIQPFQAVTFTLSGSLRGAGDTVSTLMVTFFSVTIIRVVAAYILINYFGFGLMGAWVAIFIDQLTRFFGILWRYKKGHWKYIKLQ